MTGSPPLPASRCRLLVRTRLQPFGQKGDAEEVLGERIVLGRVAGVDREQVGGELRLLEAIGEHVRVRQSDLDPRLQRLRRCRLFG